jgi:hypothetical protein
MCKYWKKILKIVCGLIVGSNSPDGICAVINNACTLLESDFYRVRLTLVTEIKLDRLASLLLTRNLTT